MMKDLRVGLAGLFAAFVITAAYAVTGTPPGTGPALPDGNWLNGLAAGQNSSYQSGISAAGTTQATSTQLAAGIAMFEIDTVASSTGVALPPAIAGTDISIYNNGANTLTIYPSIANNQAVSPAAQDTINNSSSTTISSHTSAYLFSAKTGVWAAK